MVVGCAATLRRVLALNITPQAELRVLDSVQDAHFAPGIINVIDEPLADLTRCSRAGAEAGRRSGGAA